MVIPSVALVVAAAVVVGAVVVDTVVVISGLAIFSEYLAFILLQNTSKISVH